MSYIEQKLILLGVVSVLEHTCDHLTSPMHKYSIKCSCPTCDAIWIISSRIAVTLDEAISLDNDEIKKEVQ